MTDLIQKKRLIVELAESDHKEIKRIALDRDLSLKELILFCVENSLEISLNQSK